ncbi:hypothetical protein [Terriglobus saanensis]|uniref:Uncharacterized protein n=1 Tax=Terriglobus saanensis (strain ATCC BAA-1853 / DSM 23119 / SP1PR4) TaxID=401053 RepID=E8V6K8_TERSS|nr:hypothetical protein [Terriglobus saanensis]ADV82747.1 hypothetical protein AciPR4_1943 [Terriglobus saanensis SP1PR4]
MIPNLLTKSEFERKIGNYNPFARPWKSVSDIAHALGQAHEITGNPGRFIALLGVLKLCYDWKVEYKGKKSRSWTLSRRGPGIRLLEAKISDLFHGALSTEYSSFKMRSNIRRNRAGARFTALTGIGSPDRPALRLPKAMRMLSETHYIHEFLEPRHRAYASTLTLFNMWQADTIEGVSFADFVESLDRDFLNRLDFENSSAEGQMLWVRYLSDSDRDLVELKQVEPGTNRFARDADDGDPFDTTEHSFQEEGYGRAIFVMDEFNRIYAHSKTVDQFHHSSFLGGRPTKSAGNIRVIDGTIIEIMMHSGHYKPGPAQALAICRALLVKFSGNSGTRYDTESFKDSAPNSVRAQSLLSQIRISAEYGSAVFYNALEFLKAGGDTSTLQPARDRLRRR